MAYLPGVPDVGPAAVNPVPTGAKTSLGKPGGIAATAHSAGKPSNVQHLGNITSQRGAGLTHVGGGNSGMHSLGHYGKGGSPLVGGLPGGVDPTAHAGVKMIRGGSGGMRSHIREGGLGPGRMSTPGPSNTNYSMSGNQDTE